MHAKLSRALSATLAQRLCRWASPLENEALSRGNEGLVLRFPKGVLLTTLLWLRLKSRKIRADSGRSYRVYPERFSAKGQRAKQSMPCDFGPRPSRGPFCLGITRSSGAHCLAQPNIGDSLPELVLSLPVGIILTSQRHALAQFLSCLASFSISCVCLKTATEKISEV
jgi:hypothetical protein